MLMPKKYDPLKGFQLPQVSYGGPPMPNPYQQIAQGQAQKLGGPQVAVPPMQGAPMMPPQYDGPMATDLGPLRQKYEQDMGNWDAATRAQYNQPEMPMPDRGRIQPLEGALVALGSALAGQMTKQDPSQNFYTALRTRQAGLDQEFQDKWLKAKEKHAAQSARLQGEAMIAERHLKESGADLNQHENQNAQLELTKQVTMREMAKLKRKEELQHQAALDREKGDPEALINSAWQSYKDGNMSFDDFQTYSSVIKTGGAFKTQEQQAKVGLDIAKTKTEDELRADKKTALQKKWKLDDARAEKVIKDVEHYDADRAARLADKAARLMLMKDRFDLSKTSKDLSLSRQAGKDYEDSIKDNMAAVEAEMELRKWELTKPENNPWQAPVTEQWLNSDPQMRKLKEDYARLIKEQSAYAKAKASPKAPAP